MRKEDLDPHGLTLKQRRFVNNYLVSGNGTQAAIDAGYSPESARQIATENLRKPSVQHALAGMKQAMDTYGNVTVEYIVEKLKENVERAMQERPVLSKEGKPTGEYVYQGSVANKGLELLGKSIGMWVNVPVEMNITSFTINIDRAGDEILVDEDDFVGLEEPSDGMWRGIIDEDPG